MTQLTIERAPRGGKEEYGHLFKGGEFLPFYIPRESMPQIDEADLPELLSFLKTSGVAINEKVVPPKVLRAHQRINFNMAVAMAEDVMAKPALCSTDAFILDGNHRWMAHVIHNVDMRVLEVGLPFNPAIEMLFKFPKTYSYGDGNFHPIRN